MAQECPQSIRSSDSGTTEEIRGERRPGVSHLPIRSAGTIYGGFAANAFVVLLAAVALDRSLGWGGVRLLAWERQLEFFLVWSLTLLVTGILVRQIRSLELIGEGERYGEYAAFPIALTVGALLSGVNESWQWPAWLAYGGIAILGGLLPALLVQRSVIVADASRSLTPALRDIMTKISGVDPPARLMTIPLSLADIALQFSNARLLSTGQFSGSPAPLWGFLSRFAGTDCRHIQEMGNRSLVDKRELRPARRTRSRGDSSEATIP